MARYQALEALRSQWTIERVLEHFHCDLGKANLSNCPLCYHLQDTPAPTLHRKESVFYCFRCHTGGDAFKLAGLILGTDFKGAVNALAGGDFYRDAVVRVKVERIANKMIPSKVFDYRDELREREDFRTIDRWIQEDLKREIVRIRTLVRLGELTEEEAKGEELAAWGLAENLWSELDRTRAGLLYYLRCEIDGDWTPWKRKRRTV